MFDVERGHLCIGDLPAGRIIAGLEDGLHHETSRGRSAADEGQHCVPGSEWYSRPVAADLAK